MLDLGLARSSFVQELWDQNIMCDSVVPVINMVRNPNYYNNRALRRTIGLKRGCDGNCIECSMWTGSFNPAPGKFLTKWYHVDGDRWAVNAREFISDMTGDKQIREAFGTTDLPELPTRIVLDSGTAGIAIPRDNLRFFCQLTGLGDAA